ncbi:MAG: hypothetical protein OXC46_01160 [Thaumarchaeota archaeon]|nr:hypothetical protein [Nitrososphaerota archaeon]
MQEIVIILSSLAGVATAVAVRKIPRNKPRLLSLGADSHIKSQINSLKIEKELLAKTISRLYRDDTEYSKIQRDRLLLKYQHQMGVVMVKLEKLEQAGRHPDLGPVGDGLLTLMDQKLSKLDDRLYELSSKMTVQQTKEHNTKEYDTKSDAKSKKIPTDKQKEPASEHIANTQFDFEGQKKQNAKTRQSFEITTLTSLPGKTPQFPSLVKQTPKQSTQQTIQHHTQHDTQKPKKTTANVTPTQIAQPKTSPMQKPKIDIKKEVEKINRVKALPEPEDELSIPDDNIDVDDIDKIKGDIRKVMARLDQVEVE